MTDRQDIEAFYRQAESAMQDLPFYNSALDVFCSEQTATPCGRQLCVAVTPWCMNLVLTGDDIPSTGEPLQISLPSGDYMFTAASDGNDGRYAICSLFSPVTEFSSQQVAVQTALAALSCAMDGAMTDSRERQALSTEIKRFRDDIKAAEPEVASAEEAHSVSRRAFLRGKLSGHHSDGQTEL